MTALPKDDPRRLRRLDPIDIEDMDEIEGAWRRRDRQRRERAMGGYDSEMAARAGRRGKRKGDEAR